MNCMLFALIPDKITNLLYKFTKLIMDQLPKVALVTGAGTGIGRAAAGALREMGYAVVLCGRRLEPLHETANQIGGLDENILIHCADVGIPDQVDELFSEIQKKFGRLDLLFNNAGISAPAIPMEELSYQQWQAVVDTNLTGAFLCTQSAIKIMKSHDPVGGRIINNGSISAHVPRPYSAPYTATKHAITGLTRSTALDGRPFNITCGQIDIGNAATEMTQVMNEGVLQANGTVAPEPTMNVDDVGRAVAYMASLPADSNVLFLTVMANGMPYVGRG